MPKIELNIVEGQSYSLDDLINPHFKYYHKVVVCDKDGVGEDNITFFNDPDKLLEEIEGDLDLGLSYEDDTENKLIWEFSNSSDDVYSCGDIYYGDDQDLRKKLLALVKPQTNQIVVDEKWKGIATKIPVADEFPDY